MKKLYAAYGSNLNLAQMAARCPSAKVYAKGVLNNWELVYRGAERNSHATIERKSGSTVPVLVWEIQPSDEASLDIYEGYPRYYFKRNVMVDIDGRKKKVMIYVMNTQQPPGRPSDSYIKTIRQGYSENNLDMTIFEKSLEANYFECT